MSNLQNQSDDMSVDRANVAEETSSSGDNEQNLKLRLSVKGLCSANGTSGNNMQTPTSIDQELQDAVEALGGLRYGDVRSMDVSGDDSVSQQTGTSPQFLNRMTQYSLVNGTMRVIGNITRTYEQTKENSVVVRYGAQAVESSVKTVTKPILNRYIEPNLDRIDKFACNQLDKLERSFASKPNTSDLSDESDQTQLPVTDRRRSTSADIMHPPSLPLGTPQASFPAPGYAIQGSSSSFRPYAGELQQRRNINDAPFTEPRNSQIAIPTPEEQRESSVLGRQWQIVKAGANAVGATVTGYVGSWVLSEETLNGIKYCEEWLQYAINHIEQQIAALLDHMSRLKNSVFHGKYLPQSQSVENQNAQSGAVVSSKLSHRETLANFKREIVETIKRIVEILGRYTPQYLPSEAKSRIRGFLLTLPKRWATGMASNADGSSSPDMSETEEDQETRKVLTLASESANMLKSIASVFNQTRQSQSHA